MSRQSERFATGATAIHATPLPPASQVSHSHVRCRSPDCGAGLIEPRSRPASACGDDRCALARHGLFVLHPAQRSRGGAGRMLVIAVGYEDCDDIDAQYCDPGIACGRPESGADLLSQPTLLRLGRLACAGTLRVRSAARRIVLDVADTDDIRARPAAAGAVQCALRMRPVDPLLHALSLSVRSLALDATGARLPERNSILLALSRDCSGEALGPRCRTR